MSTSPALSAAIDEATKARAAFQATLVTLDKESIELALECSKTLAPGLQPYFDAGVTARKNLAASLAAWDSAMGGATGTAVAYEPPPPPVVPNFPPVPPEPPAYAVPTEADCHWIIAGGVAKNLGGATLTGKGLMAKAYRASRKASHDLPIRIGVKDNGGRVDICGGESFWGDETLWIQKPDGTFEDIQIEIVGLTPSAEIGISWHEKYGKTKHLGIFNVGVRGPDNSFIVGACEGGEMLIIDGCWWLGLTPTTDYASGMHIDRWGTLVWRNHKWRGKTPTDPGVNLREHSGYLKSCVGGGTFILDNDLRGGNRTGFQIRPAAGENPRPEGPVVVARNVCNSYGWNMGDTAASFDGGAALTVWASPDDPVYVYDNTVLDAKYACLNVGGQPPEKNWLNEHGFPIQNVYVWGNKFENSHKGHPAGLPKRAAVTFCGDEAVHIGANEMQNGAKLTLNDQFGMTTHGIKNGVVKLHLPAVPAWPMDTWEAGAGWRDLTAAEKTAMLVSSDPIGGHP